MALTYEDFIDKPSSSKSVLVWLEPSARHFTFTLHAGSIYKKLMPEYVIAVAQDGVALTEVSAIPTSEGEYYFDTSAKELYLWATGSVNPATVVVRTDYRIFLSSSPHILPHDLTNTGVEVEYIASIESTSSFGYELDSEQIGIALEGNGDITIINTDRFFDSKYEDYFWENKPVTVYSWSENLDVAQAKKIYKGFINGKSFTESTVIFQVADFIAKLKDAVVLPEFEEGDGVLPAAQVGKLKRRLYGRVTGLKLVGLDNQLDGFTLTGTITGNIESKSITGIGTIFLDEVSPEDDIIVDDEFFKVETVDSDTALTLTTNLDFSFALASAKCDPEIPYRKVNRRWHIAHHAIKKVRGLVIGASAANRLEMDTVENFEVGDTVIVVGNQRRIRRVTGNTIVLLTNLPTVPTIGTPVERFPVQNVSEGSRNFTTFRDYDITNDPSGSVLEIEDLAEFNEAREFPLGTVTFTNGSRTVTGSGTTFDTSLKVRDWINASNESTWYEILQIISPTELLIRTAYTSGTQSLAALKKNVNYLTDESIITVECLGKTDDGTELGTWIKTGSDVVKDLLTEAGLSSDLNLDSFAESDLDSPQTIDLKLPLSPGTEASLTYREVIDLINQSVFGSLYSTPDFEIAYSTITAKKPATLIPLADTDIISWSVESRSNEIARQVIGRYLHVDADPDTGEESFTSITWTNDFVDKFLDTSKTKTVNIYLFDADEALRITQRYSLINDSSSSKVKIVTKLNLSRKSLGDKVYIVLDRLYSRLGSNGNKRKIALVTAAKKDGFNTVIEIDDVGGIWSKVCNIAADGSDIHAAADDDELARNGYFTDDNGIIDDIDGTYRSNLIG